MLDSVKERIAKYGIIADPLRFIRRTDRGKPNGVASLDNDGKILVEQLPDAALTETDPTVPSWAKEPSKPSYTPEEVGADTEGTAERLLSEHNSSESSHNDIRIYLSDLEKKINDFLGVDGETSVQLSELLNLISKAEESEDIKALTESKVNVSDIVDNLETSLPDKPLSSKQGYVLKELVDVISSDYIKSNQLKALEDRVSSLEDAIGGLIFRSSKSPPLEATENTITFVDVTAG